MLGQGKGGVEVVSCFGTWFDDLWELSVEFEAFVVRFEFLWFGWLLLVHCDFSCDFPLGN